ncbi:MAG: nitroreductase family protein [Candidatus Kariarchaeaceae archaeon]|jgi:nitroreductase
MNETIKTIHSLRSIRRFSDKEILSSDLKTILDAAVCSANASARQSYSIIVIEERKVLDSTHFYGANKALVFCVDYNRIVDTAKHLNHPIESGNIIRFITGGTDTILAAQTASIAAKSLDIDSLFTNSLHRANLKEVYEMLNLPDEFCFPLITLCLGYPVTEPKVKKGRLQNSGIIHYHMYQRLTTEELNKIVDEYDDEKKHLGMISSEKWSEMGFNHYLDWFYSEWPTLAMNKSKVEEFSNILKKAGFL